jgi:hypothetical protein
MKRVAQAATNLVHGVMYPIMRHFQHTTASALRRQGRAELAEKRGRRDDRQLSKLLLSHRLIDVLGQAARKLTIGLLVSVDGRLKTVTAPAGPIQSSPSCIPIEIMKAASGRRIHPIHELTQLVAWPRCGKPAGATTIGHQYPPLIRHRSLLHGWHRLTASTQRPVHTLTGNIRRLASPQSMYQLSVGCGKE